jgi:branched-chain amino acid transport system ATP-binding protein
LALLEIKNLSKCFGGLVAISELDMEVAKGEIRGLIGPNGAGKTTLVNLISRRFRPTHGKVIFNGEDITNLAPHKTVERGLARTFQADVLFNQKTVLENVLSGYHLHTQESLLGSFFNTPKSRKAAIDMKQKALQMLDFVGLAGWEYRIAGELPHGLQRTLGIAIALATKPKLLMLDEPVTGMTASEITKIVELIKKTRDRGVAIILIEHDVVTVMDLCDKITVINFGRKIAEGQPKEIRKNKDVINAYLGNEEWEKPTVDST